MQWTYTERVILKENYGKISMAELQKLLPNKSIDSIYAQVKRLRKRGWAI